MDRRNRAKHPGACEVKRTDYAKKRAKIKRKAAEIDTAVAELRKSLEPGVPCPLCRK